MHVDQKTAGNFKDGEDEKTNISKMMNIG